MFKKILTILLGAAFIYGALMLWQPTLAHDIATRIRGTVVALKDGRGTQEVIKIVDPATVASVIKQETPQIKAFFQKAPPESGELVIADIIDATNRERINAGLPPLKVNARLTQSAKIKTEDMITNQYFEHTSPTGVSVSDLGTRVGYTYVIIGENLALGNFTDANDLVQAWMNSPGHRANILNKQYQDIGIYAEKGTFEGHEVWFAVQHFGTNRTACPSIDKNLKNTIDSMNVDLTEKQKTIELLKRELEGTQPSDSGYNDRVDQFNSIVDAYNNELSESRGFIAQYNEQVSAFNSCLSNYQSTVK